MVGRTTLDEATRQRLVDAAIHARKNAYCPYSRFAVGAALLDGAGNVYEGCNVENCAGLSNCAERTAIYKAVSMGVRDFVAIAIVGGNVDVEVPGFYCTPCGTCRQVMKEFCGEEFEILGAKTREDYVTYTLGELLPHSFGRK